MNCKTIPERVERMRQRSAELGKRYFTATFLSNGEITAYCANTFEECAEYYRCLTTRYKGYNTGIIPV